MLALFESPQRIQNIPLLAINELPPHLVWIYLCALRTTRGRRQRPALLLLDTRWATPVNQHQPSSPPRRSPETPLLPSVCPTATSTSSRAKEDAERGHGFSRGAGWNHRTLLPTIPGWRQRGRLAGGLVSAIKLGNQSFSVFPWETHCFLAVCPDYLGEHRSHSSWGRAPPILVVPAPSGTSAFTPPAEQIPTNTKQLLWRHFLCLKLWLFLLTYTQSTDKISFLRWLRYKQWFKCLITPNARGLHQWDSRRVLQAAGQTTSFQSSCWVPARTKLTSLQRAFSQVL